MVEITLKIAPTSGGWRMECDLPLEPTYFHHGPAAEETARALAVRLTDLGCNVRVLVSDLSNRIAVTHRYFPL